MKLPKIKKRFWIPALVLTVLISAGVVIQMLFPVIVYFDIAEVLHAGLIANDFDSELTDCDRLLPFIEEVDENIYLSGFDESGNLIEPDKNNPECVYGVIAVVEPFGLRENILYQWTSTGKTHRLSPFWIYDDGLGYVRTQAKIVDVLYQTEATNFTAGDTVTLSEQYYILDRRLQSQLDYFGGGPCRLRNHFQRCFGNVYLPLENNETYLIWTGFQYAQVDLSGKELCENIYADTLSVWMSGVVCLSNPEKPSGFCLPSSEHLDRYEFAIEHYGDQLRAYVNE